jgi:hypothetical protein
MACVKAEITGKPDALVAMMMTTRHYLLDWAPKTKSYSFVNVLVGAVQMKSVTPLG